MKTILLASLLLLTLFLTARPLHAFEAAAGGASRFSEPAGNIRDDVASLVGPPLNFHNDPGSADKNFMTYRFSLAGKKQSLALRYGDFEYSEINRIRRNIIFNGQTYNIDAVLESSFEFSMIDVFYQYNFVEIENMMSKVSVGGVFQVKFLDGKAKIISSESAENSGFSVPAPLIGLDLSVGVLSDKVEANVRGTGISYSRDNFYEIMGAISWSPNPFFGVTGGYKAFGINVDQNDINLDFNVSGPYIAVELSL